MDSIYKSTFLLKRLARFCSRKYVVIVPSIVLWYLYILRELAMGIQFLHLDQFVHNQLLNVIDCSGKNPPDPRSIPLLWLDMLSLEPLPFSWQSLLGIEPTPLRLDGFPSLEILKFYDGHVFAPVNISVKNEALLHQIGASYLAHAPLPKRAVLCTHDHCVVAPIRQLQAGLRQTCQPENLYKRGHNFKNQIEAFGTRQFLIDTSKYPLKDSVRLISREPIDTNLTKEDFIFDYRKFLLETRRRYAKSPNSLDKAMYDGALYQLTSTSKYFNEPKIKGGGHFDWRFFKKLHYSDYERITILHKLARAWLKFTKTVGVKTWISHGTMLGWYWNGMNLPWDNDIDVQITIQSLLELARNYNDSIIIDLEHDSEYPMGNAYYLDVNPHLYKRSKGNGNNVIDARFIDTSTGFYIDITALSYTESSKYISIAERQLVEFNQLLNENYLQMENSQTLLPSEIHKILYNERASLFNNKEIYNCKNDHFYKLLELSPLVPTLFEGELTYVPNNYMNILKREYKRGLYYKTFNEHSYNPKLKLWIKTNICNYDKNQDCQDPNSLYYHKYTRKMTARHKNNMYYKGNNLLVIRSELIHPWMLSRNIGSSSS